MERAVFVLYRALTALLRALPLTAVCRLGGALGALAYWLAPPYRRLVLHNLGIAFGREKSPTERRALARRHFAALGSNLLASLKVPTLARAEIAEIVEIEGLETVHALNASGRGLVLAISHLGNWEVFAQISAIAFRCAIGTVFQRLGNPHLDAAFRQNRASLGCALFERKEGFQSALRMLRGGGCVGVLMDQHAGDAGVWCPLFGRLAATSSLPATLALRSGAALVPAAVYSAGVGRWRLVIDAPVEPGGRDVREVTAQLNETLEHQIRRQPADWFWVHNRWKTPRPKFLLATYKRGPARSDAPPSLQPFRLLIRASNWLGDAVMSVPAVRAIKAGRPDARVTILTPAKVADFWRTVPEVDEVLALEPGDTVFAVAKKLRAQPFDAAILFPNSLRTALEVWLAGIPRRVGVPGHRRRWLLNQIFEPKKKASAASVRPRHQVHDYLALAEFIGAGTSTSIQPAQITRDSQLSTLNSQLSIGLCPGAEYGPAKRWLPERFAETLRLIHERTGAACKVFGVEKDRPVADAILAAAPGLPVTDLVGQTTLAQLIAELRTCDLLLTNDTGTMHLAAHLGVPVVALFGSTEPALTGPLGTAHRILRRHVECSPCFLRECPLDFRCMLALEVPAVVAAIESLLPASAPPPATFRG